MKSNKKSLKPDDYPSYERIHDLSTSSGLTRQQVAEMRSKYGTNQLRLSKPVNPFILFLKQLKDPMIIILLIATIISLALGIYNTTLKEENNSGHRLETITMFVESGVILAIVLANTIWGTVQEIKTGKAMQSLSKLTSPTATVLRDNNMITIPADDVVVNDILVLDAGMSIVADGLLIESFDLQVVESVLTGESEQVEKRVGPDKPNTAIINQTNRIFAGTNVINGSGKAIVTAIGMHTQIGKIAGLLNDEKDNMTPLQKQIAKLSMILGIIAGVICIITFIAYLGAIIGFKNINDTNAAQKVGTAAQIAISLAVATIPEGVLAVVSVILATACKNMAKHNALIKKLPAVETLGSASVICSDKTGTLTQNKMTVMQVWTEAKDTQTISFNKNVLAYSVLATTADIKIENNEIVSEVGDPTETALLISLFKHWNLTKQELAKEWETLQILPFDSDRKLMSVVVKNKETNKYFLITKGAPDNVFARCINQESYLNEAKEVNSNMADQALRVLGVAIKELNNYDVTKPLKVDLDEKDLTLVGLVAEQDPVRPEAIEAIRIAKGAGIIPIMITGDYKRTAIAIAKQLGMAESIDQALSGQELNQMSDDELAQNIDKYRVYARVSPTDKIRIVKAWQANNKIVSMTGDGVNDAPSLKAADIGCAMGITGTDVSKEAADIILADDNYQTIVKAVETGRGVMQNIKQALTLLLTTNFSCLLSVFITLFLFMVNPLSSLQVLWINVVSETLPGIAMGFNKPGKNLMNLMPRLKNAFIVDKSMLIKIIVEGLLFWAMATVMFYVGFGVMTDIWNIDNITLSFKKLNDNGNIFNYSDSTVQGLFAGSGLMFLTLGLCLSTNAISMRTNSCIFFEKWKDMQWVVLASLSSIVLLVFVAYVPEVNRIFNMDLNFNGKDPAFKALNIIPFAIAFLSIMTQEIVKVIKNKYFNHIPVANKEAKIVNTINN